MSPLRTYDERRKTIFYPKTDVLIQPAMCSDLLRTREQDLHQYQVVVQDICQRVFGSFAKSVMPMSNGGTYHLVFKIERKDGIFFIVRLNRLPLILHSFDFLIDAWVYPLLHHHGLLVPSVLDVNCSRAWCNTDYQIMDYIDGYTLDAFQDPATQYMNPELLSSLGAYVARVHQVKLTGFGPIAVESLSNQARGIHTLWQEYIFLRLDEHIVHCKQHGAISDAEAVELQSIFSNFSEIFVCNSPMLLHGDLGSHNFISADGKTIAALIDWEDCMSGDPVFDIAFWGTFYKDHMLEHFLTGYLTYATLPNDFQLRYWLYYLRIALSKTVHRIHFGYQDRPDRPAASLRIQKALGNVRRLSS